LGGIIYDSLSHWNQGIDLNYFVGQKVYLPPYSQNDFKYPFLFTVSPKTITISNNDTLKAALKEEIVNDYSKKREIIYEQYLTNIYIPDIEISGQTGSKWINNSSAIFDQYYIIIDIVSEKEMTEKTEKWNTIISDQIKLTSEQKQKKKDWENSSKTWAYKYSLDARVAIILKSVKTNDTVYLIDQNYEDKWRATTLFKDKFVLVSHFIKQQDLYKNKTLIYNGEWVSNRNFRLTSFKTKTDPQYMDEPHSKWKCKDVSLIKPHYKIGYILVNEYDSILQLDNLEAFIPEEQFIHNETIRTSAEQLEKSLLLEKQKKEEFEESERKRINAETRKAEYIKKYGQKYGELVALGKFEIGMTMDMCRDSWGMPTNLYEEKTNGKTFVVWTYFKMTKLYFLNNKLTKIENKL
jgi:hypothetical protein